MLELGIGLELWLGPALVLVEGEDNLVRVTSKLRRKREIVGTLLICSVRVLPVSAPP